MASDSPEQLLDVFRAAALSVTKLYKTSASAQAKARADGYQDCLDDLLSFLDKENLGVGDGEGWRIRRWATERLEGSRDPTAQAMESEDETEKAETASSPELHRSGSNPPLSAPRIEASTRTDSAPPPSVQPIMEEEPVEIVVPTQETFDFRSQHPYPQEAYLNIANLDLSDSRPHDTPSSNPTSTTPVSIARQARARHGASGVRTSSRSANNHLGRGAGQKRKVNLAEMFDLGSLGYGKDMFGGSGGKRSRHT
ncbi:hypothetical protein NKR23_g924 [Pleurostoma richardsiae]|uniref:Uncharacterized protein n=1 Tax=Pleurostoma richardsiae TaxID=41990 RepID=A0AA38RQG2_9PEZI|nr:hypothetical protein NKR23_g924 [Pleurostoma richardsiae]